MFLVLLYIYYYDDDYYFLDIYIYNIVFREQLGYSHHTNILNISKEYDTNLPLKWDMIRPEPFDDPRPLDLTAPARARPG